jgi:curli biogenesis system outer membrane secretion channel CsgG
MVAYIIYSHDPRRKMEKKIAALLLLLLLATLPGCSSRGLTKSFLREDVNLAYIQTIAVMPFENLGAAGAAAQRIRDITITQVLASGLFDVVDRGRVDSMLREEAIEPGAPIDALTLKRMGQRLGVQAFLMGSVEQTSEARTGTAVYPETTLTLRLVDVEAGNVLWQATGRGSGYSLLDRLFGVAPKDAFRVTLDLITRMLNTIK